MNCCSMAGCVRPEACGWVFCWRCGGLAMSKGATALKKFLKDPDPEIRRTAIQWVARTG